MIDVLNDIQTRIKGKCPNWDFINTGDRKRLKCPRRSLDKSRDLPKLVSYDTWNWYDTLVYRDSATYWKMWSNLDDTDLKEHIDRVSVSMIAEFYETACSLQLDHSHVRSIAKHPLAERWLLSIPPCDMSSDEMILLVLHHITTCLDESAMENDPILCLQDSFGARELEDDFLKTLADLHAAVASHVTPVQPTVPRQHVPAQLPPVPTPQNHPAHLPPVPVPHNPPDIPPEQPTPQYDAPAPQYQSPTDVIFTQEELYGHDPYVRRTEQRLRSQDQRYDSARKNRQRQHSYPMLTWSTITITPPKRELERYPYGINNSPNAYDWESSKTHPKYAMYEQYLKPHAIKNTTASVMGFQIPPPVNLLFRFLHVGHLVPSKRYANINDQTLHEYALKNKHVLTTEIRHANDVWCLFPPPDRQWLEAYLAHSVKYSTQQLLTHTGTDVLGNMHSSSYDAAVQPGRDRHSQISIVQSDRFRHLLWLSIGCQNTDHVIQF